MADEKKTPNILNVTLPLKQDLATQTALQTLILDFETKLFPAAEAALKKSKMVHFARFVLIKGQYIQILTEYDNDFKEYTQWFATELKDFFRPLFQFVEGALPPEDVGNPDKVYAYIKAHDIPCLGGKAFSAYGALKVGEIQEKFGIA